MEESKLNEYFKFYKENELQLLEASRYTAIDDKCSNAYSTYFANLLMAISSDFEALIRYCFNLHDDEILEIGQIINLLESDDFYKQVLTQEASIKGYGDFIPLAVVSYRNSKQFSWWTVYNKIKHNKLKSIRNACQSNVIRALAGQYVLLNFALRKCSEETECKDFFDDDIRSIVKLKNFDTKYSSLTGAYFESVEVGD